MNSLTTEFKQLNCVSDRHVRGELFSYSISGSLTYGVRLQLYRYDDNFSLLIRRLSKSVGVGCEIRLNEEETKRFANHIEELRTMYGSGEVLKLEKDDRVTYMYTLYDKSVMIAQIIGSREYSIRFKPNWWAFVSAFKHTKTLLNLADICENKNEYLRKAIYWYIYVSKRNSLNKYNRDNVDIFFKILQSPGTLFGNHRRKTVSWDDDLAENIGNIINRNVVCISKDEKVLIAKEVISGKRLGGVADAKDTLECIEFFIN